MNNSISESLNKPAAIRNGVEIERGAGAGSISFPAGNELARGLNAMGD